MMDFSSYYSYTDSDRLNKNIQEISNFPDEKDAQIKANTYGTLGRADGSVLGIKGANWLLNAVATQVGLASEITDTVKVINNTFESVSKQFEENFEGSKEKKLSADTIKMLKDSFQNELSILEGLKNIAHVYHSRYDNMSIKDDDLQTVMKKEAVFDLDKIEKKYEELFEKHGELFFQMIESYKQEENAIDLTKSVMNPLPISKFTLEEAQTRLDAYLNKWHLQMPASEARNYIDQGNELIAGILSGEITDPANMGSAKALTCLSWALMQRALQKGQGHSEGAFAIEDKEGRLYNFLLKAEGSGDRDSSHYIGRAPQSTRISTLQKGVDVINGKLPTGKRHILFGQVDNASKESEKLLFVKLENYSPFKQTGYGYDMTMHGAEFAIAQYNKIFHPGSDDLPEMAKERVPAAVIKEFGNIINIINKDDLLMENLKTEMESKGYGADPIKEAKTFGIAYMTSFVEALGKQTTLPVELNLNDFYASLPQLDHMDKRTGKEVYLTHEELIK